MATLFDPHFQATAANGRPESGARLHFYRAGTTSRIPIYKDSAATTPHTNPVIADASGLFPPIFLAQVAPFKIILQNGQGITVQTTDRIPVGEAINVEVIEQAVNEMEALRDDTQEALDNISQYLPEAFEAVRDETLVARDEADTAKTAAQLAKGGADAAAVRAEAARDGAKTSAGVYSTTALGLAATTNGQQFHVPSVDGLELIRYQNNAGAAAEVSGARVPTSALVNGLKQQLGPLRAVEMPPESGYSAVFFHELPSGRKKMSAAVTNMGQWVIFDLSIPDTAPISGRLIPQDLNGQVKAVASEGGWAFVLGDYGGKAVGFRASGEMVGIVRQSSVRAERASGADRPMFGEMPLVVAGDSIAEGAGATSSANSWRVKLATALGVDHYNAGIGGQKAQQIAARLNAGSAMVAAFTMPASGSVDIVPTIDLLESTSNRSIRASIAGVMGTLSRNATSGVTSFLRASDGADDLPVSAGTPIITEPGMIYPMRTTIVMMGTNNRGQPTGAADTVDAAVRIARWHTPQQSRLFFIGPFNDETEFGSSANYKNVVEIEKRMASVFGDRFINIRRILIDRGLSLAGISATATDTANIADDIIPQSLRADNIHPNDAGHDVICNHVLNILYGRGFY